MIDFLHSRQFWSEWNNLVSACEQNFREIFMKNPILKLPPKEIVSGDFLALTFFVNKNKDTHNTSSHSLALNSQMLIFLFLSSWSFCFIYAVHVF